MEISELPHIFTRVLKAALRCLLRKVILMTTMMKT